MYKTELLAKEIVSKYHKGLYKKGKHVQFPTMKMVPLIDKPYVNGGTLREKNLS